MNVPSAAPAEVANVASTVIETQSAAETQAFGARLGSRLDGGEVIALRGDLGAGKTTLTQGIVAGAGSQDRVTSPTFTLVNVYHASRFEIYHVDAYRLASAVDAHSATASQAELEALALDDVLGARDAVVIVEWPEILPSLREVITLEVDLQVLSDATRQLVLTPRAAVSVALVASLC